MFFDARIVESNTVIGSEWMARIEVDDNVINLKVGTPQTFSLAFNVSNTCITVDPNYSGYAFTLKSGDGKGYISFVTLSDTLASDIIDAESNKVDDGWRLICT